MKKRSSAQTQQAVDNRKFILQIGCLLFISILSLVLTGVVYASSNQNLNSKIVATYQPILAYQNISGAYIVTGLNTANPNYQSVTEIEIPDTFNGLPVTGIADRAFHSDSLKSPIETVIIGNNVTSIGNYAFDFHMNLTNLTLGSGLKTIGNCAFENTGITGNLNIPNGVTSIGAHAFMGCLKISGVTIPSTVKTIGANAFYQCHLTELTIPNGVETIGAEAFYECGDIQGTLIIPSSVTSIGSGAFGGCPGLSGIKVDTANQYYTSKNGAGSECNVIIEKSTKTLLAGCNNSTIPTDSSVTGIGTYAFLGCSGITGTITLSNYITRIGTMAFFGLTKLTAINYNANITTELSNLNHSEIFGVAGAESKSTGVTVTIGNNVTNIPSYLFYCSSTTNITSLTIGTGVKTIGTQAFANLGNLSKLNYNAVSAEDLTNTTDAFSDSGEEMNVVIGNNVTNIPAYLFYKVSQMTSLTIGNSVISIGTGAFSGCSGITQLNIPNNVETISAAAFENCSGLINLTIGTGVKTMGTAAFYSLTSLGQLNYNAENVSSFTTNARVFYSIGKSTDSGTTVIIGDNVTSLPAYMFGKTGVTIGVTYKITSITIGAKVETIGTNAFAQCTAITEVTVKSEKIYMALTSTSACGHLLNCLALGETVTVPTSIVSSIANTYMNNTANFTHVAAGTNTVFTKV